SDGIVEAHDPQGEMFGFPRLRERMSTHRGGANLLDRILGDLAAFTGADWEQEDDVTIVTLARTHAATQQAAAPAAPPKVVERAPAAKDDAAVASTDEPTSRQIV